MMAARWGTAACVVKMGATCVGVCAVNNMISCAHTHTCMYICIYIVAMGAAGRLGVLLLLSVCLFVCLFFFFDDGVGWVGVGWGGMLTFMLRS